MPSQLHPAAEKRPEGGRIGTGMFAAREGGSSDSTRAEEGSSRGLPPAPTAAPPALASTKRISSASRPTVCVPEPAAAGEVIAARKRGLCNEEASEAWKCSGRAALDARPAPLGDCSGDSFGLCWTGDPGESVSAFKDSECAKGGK